MPRTQDAESSHRDEEVARYRSRHPEANCQVVVDVPHRREQEGNQYEVRIGLAVPGNDIVVSRVPDQQTANQEVRQAIREAFDAAGRQLQDYHADPRRGRSTGGKGEVTSGTTRANPPR